jgi:sulfate permease, SulP family
MRDTTSFTPRLGPAFWRPMWADTLSSWREMIAPKSLSDNILSGITVAFVALPLNLALALACGLPATVGLITGAVTGIIGALIGGARLQITGPEVALVPLTFEILQRHGVKGLICATFLAGLLQIAIGLARIGGLIHAIPVSVIGGFMAAVGVLVFNSQLPRILGLPVEIRAISALRGTDWLHHIDFTAVGIGLLVIATTALLPRLHRRLPGGLIGLALAIISITILELGTPTVGTVVPALPRPALPPFGEVSFSVILPEAIALALLASIDSLLAAVAIDATSKTPRHSSDQELLAQGAINIVSSLIGGMPAAGAIVRSSASIQCGATTRLAALTHALTLLGLLFLATPLVERLPLAGLGGILLVVGYRLVNWRQLRFMWKVSRFEALVFVVTALTIVGSDFVAGVFVGLVLSLVRFVHRQRHALVSLVPATADEPEELPRLFDGWPSHRRSRSDAGSEGVGVVRVEGPIFFASHTSLRALTDGGPLPRHLIFDLAGVPFIDFTGIEAFRGMLVRLREQGTESQVARASSAVAEQMREAKLLAHFSGEQVFPTVASALAALGLKAPPPIAQARPRQDAHAPLVAQAPRFSAP